MMGVVDSQQVLAILPEIGLLVLVGMVLAVDLFLRGERKRFLGWMSIIGLVIVAGLSVAFAQPGLEPKLVWGGMLRLDEAGFVFRLLFLIGAAITVFFAMDDPVLGQRGEFYILLLVSTLGMSLMASSADLVMLYLAIETTSIPLYVMAGFYTKDQKSAESGIKYLLFGSMTSAVMLYGFSLLYGFTGTTQLYRLADLLNAGQLSIYTLAGVVILILVGFGFKVAMVPFHFWAPDVYEGAPTPVTAFLSTASKAAGFVVLLRVLLGVFPYSYDYWSVVVGILATASMFMGNLLALAQKNIKRLLAYSSIAQAGYILIGVAAGSHLGSSGATYYLMAYLVTNLAAFGVVTVVGRAVGSDELSAYAGLSRRSQGLALVLLVAMLSLAGIPPFAGFMGKLLVFAAAVQSDMVWLALLGGFNSIIALYYYLVILKVVYLYRSEDETKPLKVSPSWVVALLICVVGVVILGTVFTPWYAGAVQAGTAVFVR